MNHLTKGLRVLSIWGVWSKTQDPRGPESQGRAQPEQAGGGLTAPGRTLGTEPEPISAKLQPQHVARSRVSPKPHFLLFQQPTPDCTDQSQPRYH